MPNSKNTTPGNTSQEKANLSALVNLLGALPPVKADQMTATLNRAVSLPRVLRTPYLRLWGFLHPIPYMLRDAEQAAAEAAQSPRDAFLYLYGEMTDKQREGLMLLMEEWNAEKASAEAAQ